MRTGEDIFINRRHLSLSRVLRDMSQRPGRHSELLPDSWHEMWRCQVWPGILPWYQHERLPGVLLVLWWWAWWPEGGVYRERNAQGTELQRSPKIPLSSQLHHKTHGIRENPRHFGVDTNGGTSKSSPQTKGSCCFESVDWMLDCHTLLSCADGGDKEEASEYQERFLVQMPARSCRAWSAIWPNWCWGPGHVSALWVKLLHNTPGLSLPLFYCISLDAGSGALNAVLIPKNDQVRISELCGGTVHSVHLHSFASVQIPLLLQQGSTPLMAGCANAGQETIDGMICNICHKVHCSRHVGADKGVGVEELGWGEGARFCKSRLVNLMDPQQNAIQGLRMPSPVRSSTSLIQQFLNCSQWLRIAPTLGWIICRQAFNLQRTVLLSTYLTKHYGHNTRSDRSLVLHR